MSFHLLLKFIISSLLLPLALSGGINQREDPRCQISNISDRLCGPLNSRKFCTQFPYQYCSQQGMCNNYRDGSLNYINYSFFSFLRRCQIIEIKIETALVSIGICGFFLIPYWYFCCFSWCKKTEKIGFNLFLDILKKIQVKDLLISISVFIMRYGLFLQF